MGDGRLQEQGKTGSLKNVWIIIALVLFAVLFIVPLIFAGFDNSNSGNVALIPIVGEISTEEGSSFGSSVISSTQIIDFLTQAEQDDSIDAIVLEINSPGGSAVASDEIAKKIKSIQKPVISVIREVGASGAYWIASSTDHIIANQMSITGSIGVISSYLEFSGLMEKYGVGYERLVAGKYKDIGTPYRMLNSQEEQILQGKLDKIQVFFIDEVAQNRNLTRDHVKELATGEFYLGVEALENGLVDELGNEDTAKVYLKQKYGFEMVEYQRYERQASLLQTLMGAMMPLSFHLGEGIGSVLTQQPTSAIQI